MKHFKVPTSLVDREQHLLSLCQGNEVLHLGCADYPYTEQQIASGAWLHAKISGVASRCLGVDLNAGAVHLLRSKYGVSNIIVGDAEKLDQLQQGKFDVIVAGEIIEHLNNPGLFLASAPTVLKPGGKLAVTTTNAFTFRRFLRVGFGTESIHPDHTYYYSHTTLATLAGRFGFVPLERHSYRLPNSTPRIPYIFERAAVALSPNWGEGIVHVYGRPTAS